MRSVLLVALALAFPGSALAGTTAGQPFPTNLDTTPDATQITGPRVDLPKPDCTTHPSDCADVAVLDTLDGFNIQPRISIPFSGPIDVSTVSSSTVFLWRVGCFSCAPVGVNQVVWEPLTNTLYVESDQQLAQDTTYLLVATTGLRDTRGKPLGKFDDGDVEKASHEDGVDNRAAEDYRKALRRALEAEGIDRDDVAAASLFTTQSITATSTAIRSQLHATPVSFDIAGTHTVFPLASLPTSPIWASVYPSRFRSSMAR